jgi:hypothetical protein
MLPRSKKTAFSAFVGIDQTGAIRSRRGVVVARPLEAALLRPDAQDPARWRLESMRLDSVSQSEIRRAVGPVPLARVALALDCVFGLPSEVGLGQGSLWELMRSTHETGPGAPAYGMEAAERYFKRFGVRAARLPTRSCEKLARANSVFVTRPFQKNIQTGTFRIWKDLAQTARWANVWPFDLPELGGRPLSAAPWVFEGFPSLLWRELLGSRTRDPRALPRILRARFPEIRVKDPSGLAANPDRADAAVLAVGAWALQRAQALRIPFPGFLRTPELACEGWIMGLKAPTE